MHALKIGFAVLVLGHASVAHSTEYILDHVCLPSVTDEDAAWKRLNDDLALAIKEFNVIDLPAKEAFRSSEKSIVIELNGRLKEIADRYESLKKLTYRLNPSQYPCTNAESRSADAVWACKELAKASRAVGVAERGKCRDTSPANHEAFVEEGNPCEDAAKQYWKLTSNARMLYEKKMADAEALYRQSMLPACFLWQRITGKELDRATVRARQYCVSRVMSPAALTICSQKLLNGR